MGKSILIIGVNSELAQNVVSELKKKNWKIYATSRQVGVMDSGVQEFQLDVENTENFILLKEKLANIKFDVILNFAGIAIAGAVIELDETKFKKQLDINLFGLLRIIKYLSSYLKEKGRLINISSMASYGIFPYLTPYCISKASADILLNTFSIESNIKTVSIRPGAVATKFWEKSIELNKETLDKTKFEKERDFLVKNANYNSLHALNPIYVSKKICKIVELKNPKKVYNIGLDSKIAKISRFLPLCLVDNIIKTVLKIRIQKSLK